MPTFIDREFPQELNNEHTLPGCACGDCRTRRSRLSVFDVNPSVHSLSEATAYETEQRTLRQRLDDAIIGATDEAALQATDEAEAETTAYCDNCGEPMGGANEAVTVITSARSMRDTEQYGSRCCVDSGRVRVVTCANTERVMRTRAAIHIADNDEWVHASYRGDYHLCREDDAYYADSDNMPSQADPDLEDNGLLYYGANVLEHCTHTPPASRLVFGVELEMESRDNGVSDMVALVGGAVQRRYILKSDGSLTDGIEMVTIPMTLAEHSNVYDWEKTLKPYRKAGFVSGSTTTCGIHIHVNRKALSALTIGKLLVFLNSSKADTSSFVTNVAQRKPTGYCHRTPKSVRDGREMSSDKYDALHLLPRTVEFRIFRGNMRPERILKNLEFVHALCSYMPTCSVTRAENVQEFLAWLYDNRKSYPNLHAFIEEKNARPAILRVEDDDALRETSTDELAA